MCSHEDKSVGQSPVFMSWGDELFINTPPGWIHCFWWRGGGQTTCEHTLLALTCLTFTPDYLTPCQRSRRRGCVLLKWMQFACRSTKSCRLTCLCLDAPSAFVFKAFQSQNLDLNQQLSDQIFVANFWYLTFSKLEKYWCLIPSPTYFQQPQKSTKCL